MHFHDKDELLISGIHDMLGSLHTGREGPPGSTPYERILCFSLPVFQHIHQHRRTGATMMGTRGRAVVHDHLQKVVAQRIAEDVRKLFHGRRKADIKIPPEVLVQYVASTFILVLNWWADSRQPLHPCEADALFRALIMPTLSAALP
jgi:hypothetical protein